MYSPWNMYTHVYAELLLIKHNISYVFCGKYIHVARMSSTVYAVGSKFWVGVERKKRKLLIIVERVIQRKHKFFNYVSHFSSSPDIGTEIDSF